MSGYSLFCEGCKQVITHKCETEGVFIAPLMKVRYVEPQTTVEYTVLRSYEDGGRQFVEVCWRTKHTNGMSGALMSKLRTLDGKRVLGVKGRSHAV